MAVLWLLLQGGSGDTAKAMQQKQCSKSNAAIEIWLCPVTRSPRQGVRE